MSSEQLKEIYLQTDEYKTYIEARKKFKTTSEYRAYRRATRREKKTINSQLINDAGKL